MNPSTAGASGGRPAPVGDGSFELVELAAVPEELADNWSPPERVGTKRFFLDSFLHGELDGITTAILAARAPGGELLAATAFSRMRLAMDCIAPAWLQKAAEAVRTVWPGFLVLDLLMFGLPASMADQETVFAPGLPESVAQAIREAFVARSVALLRQEKRTACVWKEFSPQLWPLWEQALSQAGFLGYPSVPVSVQEVTWDSPEDYVRRLRSSYRRQLAFNAARAREAGLSIALAQAFGPHVEEFHALYLQVLAHSKTRLELLSPAFFHGLAADARIRYLRATVAGRPVGGALCYVAAPDVLVFLYVGMDYTVMRDLDLYFNLLHAITGLAAQLGVRSIRWGQTSPDAKGRMGAALLPLSFAIRFRQAALQFVLPSLAPVLFPRRTQIARRVFNEPGSATRSNT